MSLITTRVGSAMEDETLGIQLTELETKLATNKPPVKECSAWSRDPAGAARALRTTYRM